MSVDHGGFLGT